MLRLPVSSLLVGLDENGLRVGFSGFLINPGTVLQEHDAVNIAVITAVGLENVVGVLAGVVHSGLERKSQRGLVAELLVDEHDTVSDAKTAGLNRGAGLALSLRG